MKLEKSASPGEDEAEQGADENEDLVEHGRVRPLDCSVDVILHQNEKSIISMFELIKLTLHC